MYCKECGFQLSDDARFCPNCGTKVELNGLGDIEQKAVFGDIEADDEQNAMDVKSIADKAQWQNTNVQTSQYKNVTKQKKKKIIRTKSTNSSDIFIKYYSYEDDTDSVLSPQWYTDEFGNSISEKFDSCSDIINYNLTFVSDNYVTFACCKLVDGQIKRLTPFCFLHYMTWNGGSLYLNNKKKLDCSAWAEVTYDGSSCILDNNMTLYKIVNDWWSNPLVGLFIAASGVLFSYYMVDEDKMSIWIWIGLGVFIFIFFLLVEGVTEPKLKKIAQFSNE